MIPASERYLHDPVFHNLVDTIYHYMETLELTPSEMREAVMLAAVKFESTHIRPLLLTPSQVAVWNQRMYGMDKPCDPNEKVKMSGFTPINL